MSLAISTNLTSIVARQNILVSNSRLKTSVERLSSGHRVNSAADDAAGLGRADRLRSHSRMIQASMRNINDGVSAVEVADKAAEQITMIVTRMGELAASAAQGTVDDTGRSYYNDEYNRLVREVDRIASTTEFGGFKLLNGSVQSLTMFVGFRNSADDQLAVSLMSLMSAGSGADTPATAHQMTSTATVPDPDLGPVTVGPVPVFSFTIGGVPHTLSPGISNLNEFVDRFNAGGFGATAAAVNTGSGWTLSLTSDTPGTGNDIVITQNDTVFATFSETAAQDASTATGLGLAANALTSAAAALSAIDAVSAALGTIAEARAVFGASTNRLAASLTNLAATHANYLAAESRIRDADFAFETASYTKNRLMVEAGTSVLAKANMHARDVLSLLS